MLSIKALSRNLLLLGVVGIAAAFFIWNANRLSAPTNYDRQQISIFAQMAVETRDRQIADYPKCLYLPTDAIPCPMGGNLHLLTWASAALLFLGLLLGASAKPQA